MIVCIVIMFHILYVTFNNKDSLDPKEKIKLKSKKTTTH